jgi:hypothetical protein
MQALVRSGLRWTTAIGLGAAIALPSVPAGFWSLTTDIPPNVSGGQSLFIYGISAVSNEQAFVAIPTVVGEASTTSVSDEHNWHVFNGPDSSSPSLASTQIITGPGTMDSVTFTAPTQTDDYFFWCDVHTTLMPNGGGRRAGVSCR